MSTTTLLVAVEDLFADAPQWSVPPVEARFTYKKESGSSDGQNTADEIKT